MALVYPDAADTRPADTETAIDAAELESDVTLALSLARSHREARPDAAAPLVTDDIRRLRSLVESAIQFFQHASENGAAVSYAAEWMLDNDYLIVQALRLVEEDLPPAFSRRLPILAEGWPRIFRLACEMVTLAQVRLDLDWVRRFVVAYQRVVGLSMGELWALPIMLRLAVVHAQVWAVAKLTGSEDQLVRLRKPPLELPESLSADECIANGFVSLRALAAQDWKEFFESLSLVEAALRRDPAGAYPRMDFESRDRYRKVIEDLATVSDFSELEVAATAIGLAQAIVSRDGTEPGVEILPEAHVGYYLIDQGRTALESQVGFRNTGLNQLQRMIVDHPTRFYLGGIAAFVVLALTLPAGYSLANGATVLSFLLSLFLSALPASVLAVHAMNWIVTHWLPPKVLPKMDYSQGIPLENATLVVIPALIQSETEARALAGQLEMHFLRNPDPCLYFALLSDFKDAPQAEMPADAGLSRAAVEAIETLNRRYPTGESADRFLLFHRPRHWNPSEGVWMGWERKRGKLHQLNSLILASNRQKTIPVPVQEAFSILVGRLHDLPPLRFVITLDADTVMPPDAARRLVATHAHPLNRPRLDGQSLPIGGYSVLQPRTIISPVSADRSPFTRLFSGDTGLDLYTLAVSDVYQDLFGAGIYVGKGIYDVAAFESGLEGRVPENALLSHDLFEGAHVRAGLVTDIVLIENYPSHYLVHSGRLHRWIRGDWQLLPWLFGRVPAPGNRRIPNRLSLIDRWKIFDNMRRSLVAPNLVVLLLAAWIGVLPGAVPFWMVLALLSLAGPLFTTAFEGLTHFRRTAAVEDEHVASMAGLVRSARDLLLRWLLAVVFLVYEAGLAIDAIAVTLLRLFITRRNFLSWTTAAQAERRFSAGTRFSTTLNEMIEAPVLAVGFAIACILFQPAALPFSLPFLTAWLLSPWAAMAISRPWSSQTPGLSDDQERRLRLLARQTWLFFEQFIGPEDNWLPPDHFQEAPLGVVAHRTSPTNIGLNLIASLGAYDLGYIGLLSLSARLQSGFQTLGRLERLRGHFLNWYDTRSLEPLLPRYVSTVDSGNLAACLIALRQGLIALENAVVLRRETFSGMRDSLALLEDLLADIPSLATWSGGAGLRQSLSIFTQKITAVEAHPEEWSALLLGLHQISEEGEDLSPGIDSIWRQIEAEISALVEDCAQDFDTDTLARLRLFAERTRHRLENAQREINMLQPWAALLAEPAAQVTSQIADAGLSAALADLRAHLLQPLKISGASEYVEGAHTLLDRYRRALDAVPAAQTVDVGDWCDRLAAALDEGGEASKSILASLRTISEEAQTYAVEMDFTFLFDRSRQVFHIGYNQSTGRLDANYYDLLASEARIASLIAIANRDVPQSHWLHLSRPLAAVDGRRVLLSWSATMFEYLMPALLIRAYENTLLGVSLETAVDLQIAYGVTKGVPWGISESGFFHFDAQQAYQYRAFGVPGMGYKRGLGDDVVVSPYASLLSLPYRPAEVAENVAAIDKLGGRGVYGLYEAIDFTSERLPLGSQYEIVRQYMAHHQGMILISLVNYFCNDIFVRRFHADPLIASVDLLLQEQFPIDAPLEQAHLRESHILHSETPEWNLAPWRARLNAPQPRVHVLSNGRYGVLLTAAGGGWSVWKGIDLTRWRSDGILGDWGQWYYVEDLDAESLWSIGFLPTGVQPDSRDVYFSPHMATYTARHGDVGATMSITIPPDDDVEVRKIELTNYTDQSRRLRITSYGEVILTRQADDRRHPAFSNLFIRSEWVADAGALVFYRRPRSPKDAQLYLAHILVYGDLPEGQTHTDRIEFGTDRGKFLGRLRTTRRPRSLSADPAGEDHAAVSAFSDDMNAAGISLDPIFSIRTTVEIPAHSSVELAYLTLAAPTREAVLVQVERYRQWMQVERAFEQARLQAEADLRRLGINTPQLVLIQNLLSGLLFPQAALRAPAEVLEGNQKGQPALWAYSISGDYPILLLKLHNADELGLVAEVLQAHAYWRRRGLKIDLVILNEQGAGYSQELDGQVRRYLNRSGGESRLNQRGGIFLLSADRLVDGDRALLETAARVVLDGKIGSLERTALIVDQRPVRLPAFIPSLPSDVDAEPTPVLPRPMDWLFDNGWGGFSPDGREYQIYLDAGRPTPAPWVNVLANPEFGCLASEAGLGFTWSINSGENRLSPWSNDPVSDTSGEAVYLRDEESGVAWTPTALPAGPQTPILVRHGAGYTIYENLSHGLQQRLQVFTPPDAPVKIVHLQLKNTWTRVRRITITYYVEWVLGVQREDMHPFIIPEYDGDTQSLLARNPYSVEFGERVAFAAAGKKLHGLTADRAEFLGRNGSRAFPAALKRIGLSGAVRAGLDSCAALQLHVDLQPGESEDVTFLLGQGSDREQALALVRRFQDPLQVEASWEANCTTWDDLLSTLQVHTPDLAMDLLLNRWLLLQALAGRLWGRSAFYQSSGAYGFRDQLQDVMALVYAAPHLARRHLLYAAEHQFEAGDVLHWWHPPSGRGVRTRFSDDLLWLPYVTAFYVRSTQDESILDEKVPFLSGAALEPGQDEHYGQFSATRESYSLADHCRRAIERGSTHGPHGLPLIGGGDWNDGMNRVGNEGRGESVWLAWFLIDTLNAFAQICQGRGEAAQANLYRQRAKDYARAVDEHAWDGSWYLRAFYDDGTPLGSQANRECRIDAIAQSWAVLSGAGDLQRSWQAMQAVSERLVRLEDRLVLLLTPPFDRTPRDPGYIKGYPPGVRENGGQYTHAAIWTAWAFARLGEGNYAGELFRTLNPIGHTDTAAKAARYRVEPYVIAADVYSVEPYTGRGGWTWYTGSAGWMYRLGVEALLGLQRCGDALKIDPCIPADWPGYELTYRTGGKTIHIRVENPQHVQRGVAGVWLNSKPLEEEKIPLSLDDGEHEVRIVLGPVDG